MMRAFIDLGKVLSIALVSGSRLTYFYSGVYDNEALDKIYGVLAAVGASDVTVVVHCLYTNEVSDGCTVIKELPGNSPKTFAVMDLADVRKIVHTLDALHCKVKWVEFSSVLERLTAHNVCLVNKDYGLNTIAVFKSKLVRLLSTSDINVTDAVAQEISRHNTTDVCLVEEFVKDWDFQFVKGIPEICDAYTRMVMHVFDMVWDYRDSINVEELAGGEPDQEALDEEEFLLEGNGLDEMEYFQEEDAPDERQERKPRRAAKRRKPAEPERRTGSTLHSAISIVTTVALLAVVLASGYLFVEGNRTKESAAKAATYASQMQSTVNSTKNQITEYQQLENQLDTVNRLQIISTLQDAGLYKSMTNLTVDSDSITIKLSMAGKNKSKSIKKALSSQNVSSIKAKKNSSKGYKYTIKIVQSNE